MKLFKAIVTFLLKLIFRKKRPEPDRPTAPVEPSLPFEDGADIPADTLATEVTPDTLAEMQDPNLGSPEPMPDVSMPAPTGPDGRPKRIPRYMWLLDNGHGKATPGKRSPRLPDGTQLLEYEFTRDIVARIIQKLDALGIAYNNLVPEVEGDISLATRVQRASAVSTSLPKFYLSIHANANGNAVNWDAAEGIETWFYGPSKKGLALASAFQRALIGKLAWKDRGARFHDPADKAFYVLRRTSMPAVLTENGFYTNQAECLRLKDTNWRAKIAQAHVDAIIEIEDKGIDNIQTYSKVLKIAAG